MGARDVARRSRNLAVGELRLATAHRWPSLERRSGTNRDVASNSEDCFYIEAPIIELPVCKDAFHDNRGWILPLNDNDLRRLVEERKMNPESVAFKLLEQRFSQIVS